MPVDYLAVHYVDGQVEQFVLEEELPPEPPPETTPPSDLSTKLYRVPVLFVAVDASTGGLTDTQPVVPDDPPGKRAFEAFAEVIGDHVDLTVFATFRDPTEYTTGLYYFLLPPSLQPNPWQSIFKVGEAYYFNNINNSSQPTGTSGIAKFEQVNVTVDEVHYRFGLGAHFGLDDNGRTPNAELWSTQWQRIAGKPWPSTIRGGDVVALSISYSRSQDEPEEYVE